MDVTAVDVYHIWNIWNINKLQMTYPFCHLKVCIYVKHVPFFMT